LLAALAALGAEVEEHRAALLAPVMRPASLDALIDRAGPVVRL
jgi:hypothetical protein